jgi:divalent metal cation (Fe/Co/Zn/Cd) transporter
MKTSENVSKAIPNALLRRGLLVEYSSLVWMTVEALGAIAAGLFAGSIALLAFGGDSIIELASSVAVLDHLRTEGSGQGTDDKTERAERATLILLFLLIPILGLGAAYAYFIGVEPEPSILGILIAVGSLVIMPVLWFEKRRIGKEANCLPIEVDATESATCFLMSAALLVGLIANFLWRLWWVDYLATVVIILFIAREGVEALQNFRVNRQDGLF